MAITPGSKLGPYEIQSPLGAGGMGEVYRAKDTRLDRTVAIKVLPAHLSSDTESRQRMQREARAISALQHANICTLHDVGSHDGTDFLVMEYLEGQTLADRLQKGALPLDQVLKIGIEIADALEKAHQQGIIHRDLKPGNIMLTKAGAKLMDFGLAKPKVSIPSQAVGHFTPTTPTMNLASIASAASPITQKGSVVGTFQYIAPEVLQGADADARSDVFAFGCVLYEMVTGRRAFEGKSQLSIFTAILEKEPEPISTTQAVAPPMLDLVVHGCLAKDPAERTQSIHDVAMELRWIASLRGTPADADSAAAPARSRLPWIVAIAAAAILAAVAGFFLHRSTNAAASIRAEINPPPDTRFRLTSDLAGPPVLSPDGNYVAYTAIDKDGKTNLWIRRMNAGDARILPDTSDAIFPFWSPDSHSLGFFANSKLRTIDLNGTSAQTLCDAQLGRGGAWSPSGVIVFSASPLTPLFKVSVNGGSPTQITTLDPGRYSSHRWPFFLPDGKHFLYFAMDHDPSKQSNNGIFFASLDGTENRLLIHTQSNAIYAAGYLLFSRNDQLMAQRFDPDKGALSGEAQLVSSGVLFDSSTWHTSATATDSGLLAFGSGTSGGVELVWVDREGKQLGVAADNLQKLQFAALSPRGDRVALQIDTGVNDIWVLDLARGVRTRLTFGPIANTNPVWSPDEKWIAYSALRPTGSGIYRRLSDGSGSEELLVPNPAADLFAPDDWSRDGKTLFFSPNSYAQQNDRVWAVSIDGDRKPHQVLAKGSAATLSPDERWLAYNSVESGQNEVYVQAYGGGQGKWQVSPDSGQMPHWSADGKELFYFDGNQNLVSVTVTDSGGALQFGAPKILSHNWTFLTIPFFSVAPDGKRFLMERISEQVNQSITLVTNFTSGLKK
jgi:eukaryotic-like serine/threonine-protein kinase